MALNLEKQLQFYGAYHHDPVNVAIHITCVPLLLFTGILLGTNTPAISVPDYLQVPNLPLNAGTIAGIIYASFYVLLEPAAGTMVAPLVLGGTALGNYLTSTYGYPVNFWATIAHVVAWLAQFVGHGVFEGRAPALLDNLVQAILLAPFFVWLEVLFMVGYRPELKARLDKAVEKDIQKFKQSQKGETVNGGAH